MQASFTRLDDALIERLFQPLADTIMNRFGLDRLRAACLCLDGASLAWIISQAGALGQAVSGWNAGTACLHVLLLILGLAAMTSLRSLFQRISTRGANPLRSAMVPHRGLALALLIGQALTVYGLAGWAELAMLGLAAAALYLSACRPRPPVRRSAAWLLDAKA